MEKGSPAMNQQTVLQAEGTACTEALREFSIVQKWKEQTGWFTDDGTNDIKH